MRSTTSPPKRQRLIGSTQGGTPSVSALAPLIHRSYVKPMGYAGDYGTVKKVLENRIEGPSTYARVLNQSSRAWICPGGIAIGSTSS